MIITPIYRSDLSETEIELVTLSGRTTPHPQIFVAPSGMDTAPLRERFPRIDVVFTDADNLASTRSYNHWLTSQAFYDMWPDFEWILIAQFDALVRSNPWADLTSSKVHWDYLGAPWSPAMRVVTVGNRILVRSPSGANRGPAWVGLVGRRLHVGNGGLSLRRRESFSQGAGLLESKISRETRHHTNEDVLWAAFGPKVGIRVAPRDQAERIFWETISPEALDGSLIPQVSGYHGIDRWPAVIREQMIGDVRCALGQGRTEGS